MVNRKLVRPKLAEIKEKFSAPRASHATAVQHAPPRESQSTGAGPRRRPAPPEQTNAEAFYYLKQMNGKTPMVLVLDNEERLRGHIEWYDRQCLKIHREDGPNVLVFKHSIRYLHKEEDEPEGD